MSVLVTGGAGFIGSNLVEALVQQGEHVVVLDNLFSGRLENLENVESIKHMRFVQGDIRDPLLLDRIMPDVDVVYHLAASVGNQNSIERPALDTDINAVGTLTLLECMRNHQVKKIVLSSSAGIFGELKQCPIKEDHPLEPRTPYGTSKLYAEKMALSYAALYGMEAICLRYFNVYGRHQLFDAYGNVIPIFVHHLLKKNGIHIYGDGQQTRDFVYVADVVQANIKAGQTMCVTGVFNIGSGTQVSINQLVDTLAAIMKVTPQITYQPKRAGDVQDSLADIHAASTVLNYHPSVTLASGLAEYVKWMSQCYGHSMA